MIDPRSSKDEEARQRARDLIDSNSGLSRRTMGWMFMITEPVVMEVVEKVQRAALAQFEAAKEIYEGYRRVEETTGMSLRAYCHSLCAHDEHNQSWKFYRNWYRVYKHFIVLSEMKPDQLLGISFRLLRAVAETGPHVFDANETKGLIVELKKTNLRPNDQWELFKNRTEEIKAAKGNKKRSKGQDERRGYRRSLFGNWVKSEW